MPAMTLLVGLLAGHLGVLGKRKARAMKTRRTTGNRIFLRFFGVTRHRYTVGAFLKGVGRPFLPLTIYLSTLQDPPYIKPPLYI